MAETGRHTNTVSGKRRPQNVYVDGNTVRKVQEVPERREYRQPEHSVRKNKACLLYTSWKELGMLK